MTPEDVARWLTAERDRCLKRPDGTGEPAWFVLDNLINRWISYIAAQVSDSWTMPGEHVNCTHDPDRGTYGEGTTMICAPMD